MRLVQKIKGKWQGRRFFLRSQSKSEGVCYEDINDLPLINWDNLLDTNDISHLVQSGEPSNQELVKAYYKIVDGYRDVLGTSDDFVKAIKLKVKLEMAEIALAKGDKSQQNTINMINIDLGEQGEARSVSRQEERAMISKFMGFRIDPEKETLGSYCGYILNMRSNVNN